MNFAFKLKGEVQQIINEMDKKNLAFGKINFILLAVSVAIIILGFILMSGGASAGSEYNPEIFSAVRVKVAPVVTFIGFISIIGAIMYRPGHKDESCE